jgi:hypothetical protein
MLRQRRLPERSPRPRLGRIASRTTQAAP